MNIEILNTNSICSVYIFEGMLECCYRINKYSPNNFKTPQELFQIAFRPFYLDEDLFYILKINAYWGDVKMNMSVGENMLLQHMIDVAKIENIGLFSILYNFYKEHCLYSSDKTKEHAPMSKWINQS